MLPEISIYVPFLNNVLSQSSNKLDKRKCENPAHCLLRYNKLYLEEPDVFTYGLFRSVIVDVNTHQLVSYSPSKSIQLDYFVNHVSFDRVVVEEIVEGTMINVYHSNGDWHISTKSVDGANTIYYPNEQRLSFKDLFYQIGLDLTVLDTKFCYCFVLRHPLHKIVLPIDKPTLYLVGVYEILPQVGEEICVRHFRPHQFKEQMMHQPIHYPTIYFPSSYDELMVLANNSFKMGIMIHDLCTGFRTKVLNAEYEMVRELRGFDVDIRYCYVTKFLNNELPMFITYFPEYTELFTFYDTLVTKFYFILMEYFTTNVKAPSHLATHLHHLSVFWKRFGYRYGYDIPQTVWGYICNLKQPYMLMTIFSIQ